ncbi:uncharacterized protein [Watersipora subatra]|uniref:uncharacterized protein n=1 Tax=Watersipora subatra TaxID=2589382 RepID=UPI00355ADD7F
MARFSSFSNEILNCRTIDDGLTENWKQQVGQCVSKSTIGEDASPDATSRVIVKLPTQRVRCLEHASDSVARGFMTVLRKEDPRDSLVRDRSFYKSDFAPQVNLKVSKGSSSFIKRNTLLREKMKSLFSDHCYYNNNPTINSDTCSMWSSDSHHTQL